MAGRRIAVELVVTGSQQARQVLNNFSSDLRILEQQSKAFQIASTNFRNASFPEAGPRVGQTAGGGLGFQVGQTKQQLSALGNTIKVVTDLGVKLADGTEILGTKVTNYTGNVEKLLLAEKNYATALDVVGRKEDLALARIGRLTSQYSALRDVQNSIAGKAQGHIAFAENILNTPNPRIPILQQEKFNAGLRVSDVRTQFAAGTRTQQDLDIANAAYAQATDNLAEEVRRDTARRLRANNLLNAATTQLTEATTEEARLAVVQARRTNAAQGLAGARRAGVEVAGQAAINAAYNSPASLPGSIQTIARESPNLLRKLQQSGLGGGAAVGSPEFNQNLINQGAYESINVQRDLVRQVTRVTGSFNDQKGVLQSFNAEYDKSGRVITRFGSNLSGIGNVLNQLGRDFQKVIEFAIATTIVFGSFQYALKELDTIKELDKSIRQLSITANLTRGDALKLFGDISNIAIATATPLKELVKATDDIALATKRAGISSREWQEDILSLTQSVGILTNLAGIDTVEATDQLVSTMKQLNLQADDLPGILNKVTAVAGGQSNAIADIIKGLGVMAEAGQQASLSIDQMIATIQTLSQVTSKSPSEVATALKNLVGSIDGPAGTKALTSYNIALKDSAGNLRNIIDIYTEISDKIDKGIIPESDVKALVRAIAGGPRRAPDAAALLSSVGDINNVALKSINATNEALIANAKILDTASAKFIQLQAAIDKFATSKFADTLNEGAGVLAETLTKVLNVLEAIPTGAYLAVIQFGLLAAAVKFGISVGTFLIGTLTTMGSSFLRLAGSIGAATTAQQAFNATGQQGPVGPARSLASRAGRFGSIAGAAAIGGGLAASSGANLANVGGTALQTAGLVALSLPEPVISKGAAAALIAAGFALQFFGSQQKEVAKASSQSTEEILNAMEAYKNASTDVTNLTKAQADISPTIDSLVKQQDKSKDSTAQLISLQTDYADNAAKLVSANLALSDSFNNLNTSLENTDFSSFQLKAAQAGTYSEQQLRELTQQITPKILAATNPNFIAPKDFILPNPQLSQFAATQGGSNATIAGRVVPGSRGPITNAAQTFDLTKLESDANTVLKLFNESGNALVATFAPTYDNLQLIDNALKSIQQNVDPAKYQQLQQTFQGYASDVNALFGAERNVALYKAYLDAGGATTLFKPEEVQQGKAILDIYQQLVTLIPKGLPRQNASPGTSLGVDPVAAAEALKKATSFAFDDDGKVRFEVTREAAIEAGTAILKYSGQFDDLEKKGIVLKTIANLFKESNIEVLGLTDSVEILGSAASETFTKFIEGLDSLKQDTATTVAQKLADLQARLQGGEFTNDKGVVDIKRYDEQEDQLVSLLETVTSVADAYEKAADNLPGFQDALLGLEAPLSSINGLQDAQTLSADQLVGRLFDLAETYGLTGDQVDILGTKLLNLITIVNNVAAIKAKLNIAANVDLTQAIAAVRVLNNIGRDERPGHGDGAGPYDAELAQLIAAQKAFGAISTDIGNLYKKGQGTSFNNTKPATKAAKKKATPPDVSELDLPDEIADSINRSSLIQEAIKRARALQSKIPGAGKEAKNDIVELLKGTQRILEVRGVKDDLLRRALNELAEIEKKKLEFETKADTIRRIRVGAGTFAGIANVPVNTRTGVSLGSPNGPINVTLNLNGTIATPAQMAQFADLIAASLKRQIANG